VLGGRIYSGASFNAGEVAYCPVGGSNFDLTLSGSGLRRFYEEAGGEGKRPVEIGKLGQAGDETALAALGRFGAAVGEGIGMLCAVLDPQVCAVGGSVAKDWTLFETPLRSRLQEILAPPAYAALRLTPAMLPNAAVVGAAQHALRNMER
jgi:glucokinase